MSENKVFWGDPHEANYELILDLTIESCSSGPSGYPVSSSSENFPNKKWRPLLKKRNRRS